MHKIMGIVIIGWILSGHAHAQGGNPVAKEIKTKTGVEMILVEGGSFVMGNEKGKISEKPEHKVCVSPFYMDKYEVKQGDFEKMTGQNPSKFGGKDNPVDRVRWYEAALYCNERSKREGLSPCYDENTWACDFSAGGYRLPTEAEWEYACRGGTQSQYYFGDNDGRLGEYAWYKKNSDKKTHQGGKKKPNPFGLYDLTGNLCEWCNDNYQENYYSASSEKDPRGPAAGKKKVLRGGAWATGEDACRSAYRLADDPANADICQGYDTYGFRCVRKP